MGKMDNMETLINETENRLHITIPKVYKDFLAEGNEMIFHFL